jgi:hypothetical protein
VDRVLRLSVVIGLLLLAASAVAFAETASIVTITPPRRSIDGLALTSTITRIPPDGELTKSFRMSPARSLL